jgi:hypothetical protein
MTVFIIISALIFIFTAFLGAREGYLDAKNGTDPDHSKDFIRRVVVGSIVCLLFNGITSLSLLRHNLTDWIACVLYLLVIPMFMLVSMGFLYGACLNVAYNLKKNKPITHIGSTAETDKFVTKAGIHKLTLVIFISGALLFGFIYYAWIFSN